jgi:hypothetical protein
MSEINEFNTGETTAHSPWECEDYLCVPCNKAIDDFMAKVEEDKVDEERL